MSGIPVLGGLLRLVGVRGGFGASRGLEFVWRGRRGYAAARGAAVDDPRRRVAIPGGFPRWVAIPGGVPRFLPGVIPASRGLEPVWTGRRGYAAARSAAVDDPRRRVAIPGGVPRFLPGVVPASRGFPSPVALLGTFLIQAPLGGPRLGCLHGPWLHPAGAVDGFRKPRTRARRGDAPPGFASQGRCVQMPRRILLPRGAVRKCPAGFRFPGALCANAPPDFASRKRCVQMPRRISLPRGAVRKGPAGFRFPLDIACVPLRCDPFPVVVLLGIPSPGVSGREPCASRFRFNLAVP